MAVSVSFIRAEWMSVSLAVYQDSGVAQRSEDIAKNPTDEIIQNQAALLHVEKKHFLTPNLQGMVRQTIIYYI